MWEGFSFAKEHLALVGAAVLCRGAAAPGFHSQPSTRSEQELLTDGQAVPVWLCQRGCASLWPGSSFGARLGEVGSRLSPPHQQQRVCRASSPVAVALLVSPGRPGSVGAVLLVGWCQERAWTRAIPSRLLRASGGSVLGAEL